jgi:hypothetical protein
MCPSHSIKLAGCVEIAKGGGSVMETFKVSVSLASVIVIE